jgi:hypothetical protein
VAPLVSFAFITLSVIALALASQQTLRPGWVALGQLAQPRSLATTVPLPTGDVLVVGGIDENDPSLVSTTSELIDPFSGTSRVLPDKLLGRVNHTATLTGEKVVVTGGTERVGAQWQAVTRVDVYDVTKKTWKWSAPITAPRSDHGATALRDGRVLVAGGTDGPIQLSSVEIYDPAKDRWTRAAPLPEPRSQFSIATLNDGRVLVAAGLVRGVPSSTSVLYDPVLDVWDWGPPMQAARVLNTSVKLRNGDLLLIGGQRDGGGNAERYDAKASAFLPAGTLVQPRMLGAAVRIPDGRVLLVGGLLVAPERNRFIPLASAEIWDDTTNNWSDAVDPSTARALGSFVLTQAGALWIGGAGDGEHALRSIERFTWR